MCGFALYYKWCRSSVTTMRLGLGLCTFNSCWWWHFCGQLGSLVVGYSDCCPCGLGSTPGDGVDAGEMTPLKLQNDLLQGSPTINLLKILNNPDFHTLMFWLYYIKLVLPCSNHRCYMIIFITDFLETDLLNQNDTWFLHTRRKNSAREVINVNQKWHIKRIFHCNIRFRQALRQVLSRYLYFISFML